MTASADQLEIVRILLGFGLFLANVAVWRGVYLENEDFPAEKRKLGWKLLICGLGFETACAFALLAVDTTISLKLAATIKFLLASSVRGGL
ncbi:MAG: hypothetical protein E7774_16315 [Bradyrhizobium sp.]|nr:MAG: hypothetical protein E7774_16315 [Bradyrhizobium sp.]